MEEIKSGNIEEAIITLAKCIDEIELVSLIKSGLSMDRINRLHSREDLIKEILYDKQ